MGEPPPALHAEPQTEALAGPLAATSFANAEEYMAFMREPERVVRLEWRKARRAEHRGWTSHSWIEACLLDDRRLRFEFYADQGLAESILTDGIVGPESELYEGCVAEGNEFSLQLTAGSLRVAAASVAKRPYSVTEFNCHHFVLEVWNRVVIEARKQRHYPDRVKTGIAFLGKHHWVGGLFAAFASRREQRHREDTPALDEGHVGASLTGRAEEGQRISGEVLAIAREAPEFDRQGRLDGFCQAVKAGTVFLLEAGGTMMPTSLPEPEPLIGKSSSESFHIRRGTDVVTGPSTSSASWCKTWLPDAGEKAERLIERIGATDVIDLVAHILKPGAKCSALTRKGRAPFASISSQSSSAAPFGVGAAADACYVVLQGQELRLAIYAILRSKAKGGASQAWRLRLLSGDARAGNESEFVYTLLDLQTEASPADLARNELQSLNFALSTNDWGFITLL